MGRLPRAMDDGLVYHAINRGNNRGHAFEDGADHVAFLEAVGKTKERYPFGLLGYRLMSNHFHLLLRPESGQSISRILQSLTVTHTWRYHKRLRIEGHVWQGRFKSPVIQDNAPLLTVLRQIEATPLQVVEVANADAEFRKSPRSIEADPTHSESSDLFRVFGVFRGSNSTGSASDARGAIHRSQPASSQHRGGPFRLSMVEFSLSCFERR
jgi:REP element-mobilizing transposase RayT